MKMITALLLPSVRKAEWDESQHPRDDHGRFGEGSGGEATSPLYNYNDAKPREYKVLKDIYDHRGGEILAHKGDKVQGKVTSNRDLKIQEFEPTNGEWYHSSEAGQVLIGNWLRPTGPR